MAINGNVGLSNGYHTVKKEQEIAHIDDLPDVQHDLIPLGVLVERVAGQAFADLHNLAEVFVISR